MSAVAVQLEEPALAWVDVCALDDILPDTGVAALVGGRQIAVVRVGDGDGEGAEVYALDNFDPFSRAFVIARGIVGDRAGIPKIASPIFKQSFDLGTGQCLDDPAVRLASFPARVAEGRVLVAVPSDDAARGT
jgi:nitrite reductase (NADH) small subunit